MPASSIPTEWSAVLRFAPSSSVMRRDHLDAKVSKLRVEFVAVVGTVTDEPLGEIIYESGVERVEDKRDFMALTTRNPDGDRKAVAVCHCHDLGRLAASSSSNKSAPLFAPA